MIKFAWRIGIPVSSQSYVWGIEICRECISCRFINIAFFLKIDLFREWILQIELFPLSQQREREEGRERARPNHE